jgi:uncharacterized protein
MERTVLPVSLTLVLVIVLVFVALAAREMGIITRGEKGTYDQFGLNLQSLVKPRGINLSENVDAVSQKPGTQLGIVQADVLAFVARVQADPVLKRIAKKTKMVFPLYHEEIHLLARLGIAEFDDPGRSTEPPSRG